MIRKKPLPVLSSLFFAFLFGQSIAQSTDQLSGLEYRNIGPHRGGRVTAVTGVPGELFTFFMGTTGGGVWKTTDGGLNWQNISDGFFNVGSIGAVEVAPSDPNVVYAGTGSGCPRGNISPGDGIYKSTDGGRTWKHVGLEQSGAIARMAIDPADPDRVYAAVLGNPFGPSEERGVFRTKDGGATWEKVLYISDRTGAADLVLQPGNARVIYAGMWTAERKPWTLIDGSEEGGVWKSTDGGDSLEKAGKRLTHRFGRPCRDCGFSGKPQPGLGDPGSGKKKQWVVCSFRTTAERASSGSTGITGCASEPGITITFLPTRKMNTRYTF